MPKFYFDCIDGAERHPDAYGVELKDVEEAADHAACLAGTMLNETMRTEGLRAIAVVVRTGDSEAVYAAHCTFHGHMMSASTAR